MVLTINADEIEHIRSHAVSFWTNLSKFQTRQQCQRSSGWAIDNDLNHSHPWLLSWVADSASNVFVWSAAGYAGVASNCFIAS